MISGIMDIQKNAFHFSTVYIPIHGTQSQKMGQNWDIEDFWRSSLMLVVERGSQDVKWKRGKGSSANSLGTAWGLLNDDLTRCYFN